MKEYFCKINVPKEISGTSSMLEGAKLRKRKGDDLLVEDPKRLMMSKKSRCLLVEDDEKSCGITISRTLCPILWGAKSGNGRDKTDGQEEISGKGLDLFALTTNGNGTSRGLDEEETGNRIYSQSN